MVALVRHHPFHAHFAHRLHRSHRVRLCRLPRHLRHGAPGFRQSRRHARGVPTIGGLHRQRHHRACLQIHRVLGLVGQMRPAVLHLRDPRFPVVRIHPVPVRQRLLALAVKALAFGRRRLLDAFGLHQLRDVLVVAGPVVPPHDRFQRRVGFQRRGVHSQVLAAQQPCARHPLQHPPEHRLVRPQVHQPPCLGQRRVVRRLLLQAQAQELPQTERVRYPVGNPALGVDPLKVAHQKATEVHARRDRRTAHRRRVVLAADPLRVGVKLRPVENLVQPAVEGVPPPSLQLARLHPEGSLLSASACPAPCPIIGPKHSHIKMFRRLYPRAARARTDLRAQCQSYPDSTNLQRHRRRDEPPIDLGTGHQELAQPKTETSSHRL